MGRKRILLVEQNRDGTVGGSHQGLLILAEHLNRSLFEPVVAFYERHALWEDFRACSRVVLLPSHKPFHLRVGYGGVASVAAVGVRKAVNFTRASGATLGRVARVVAQLRPDLIYLNNGATPGAEWAWIARLCRARTVIHQCCFLPAARYVRRFDRIFCVSRAIEAHLRSASPFVSDKLLQIYDGLDMDKFRQRARAGDATALRQELGVKEGEVLIGLVGNIQVWKGQDVLMRALPLLSGGALWRCFFIGGVPTDATSQAFHTRLQELARAHAVQDRVVFTGYRADVAALMSLVDVVVSTSVEPDPMPFVVVEGMALGKPVIATNHGGPPEAIEHGRSGFLVPPGDPRALAACLNGLLASPELRARVGAEALASVTARFSVSQYMARVQEVFLSLLARARVRGVAAGSPGASPPAMTAAAPRAP